jgi:hypothetical protein
MGKKKNICLACQKGNCKNCKSSWSCDCQCNKNGFADKFQRSLATLSGFGMAIGGVALTLATGGLAVPIGGALIGLLLFLFLSII